MADSYLCYKCKNLTEEGDTKHKFSDGQCLCKICNEKMEIRTKLENPTIHKGSPLQVGSQQYFPNEGEGIQCPYCGYVHDAYEMESEDVYRDTDEDISIECSNCEETFLLSVQVSYSRTTRKVIEDKDVEGEYKNRKERAND